MLSAVSKLNILSDVRANLVFDTRRRTVIVASKAAGLTATGTRVPSLSILGRSEPGTPLIGSKGTISITGTRSAAKKLD